MLDFFSDFFLLVFICLTLFLPGGSGADFFTFLTLFLLTIRTNNGDAEGGNDDDDDDGGVGDDEHDDDGGDVGDVADDCDGVWEVIDGSGWVSPILVF